VSVTFAHARAGTVELARHPAYVVPTLAFPAVFFLFFALPATQSGANERMAAFAAFAAIGVAFFQFGVGIAAERASPWEAYVRTLPIGAGPRLAARLCSAAVFAVAAAAVVIAVAVATTPVSLAPQAWTGVAASLIAATAPFAAFGIAIGYWAPPRGALPIANLLYLTLSYAGGLWFRPAHLPSVLARLAPFLPTRALGDAVSAPATAAAVPWGAWLVLAAFGAASALVAAWGYRRDEGRRYR
jgi:ABC-2 type transport system permease protein